MIHDVGHGGLVDLFDESDPASFGCIEISVVDPATLVEYGEQKVGSEGDESEHRDGAEDQVPGHSRTAGLRSEASDDIELAVERGGLHRVLSHGVSPQGPVVGGVESVDDRLRLGYEILGCGDRIWPCGGERIRYG